MFELTPVEKKKQFIVQNSDSAMQMLKNSVISSFNLVWFSEDATPQEMFDAFGTKARDLFNISYQAQLFLKAVDDSWEMLVPPKPYTINDNGSVTVND